MRIIVQDNFDDNNFNTNWWTEHETDTATCIEQNQRIELICPVNGATKYAGFYTNPLPIQGIYVIEAKFRCNIINYSSGHRGIFIRRSANYGRDLYGGPSNGVYIAIGATCGDGGGFHDGSSIWYDATDAWHCPHGTEIDTNYNAIFFDATDHQIKLIFNGTTGKIEFWIDGTKHTSGIVSAAALAHLVGGTGNKIAFEFGLSNYNEDRKHYWDDVRILDLISGRQIFV